MSFVAKRRLVSVLLVILALWPLAHRVLVARFEINPWRLAGWAMYCTPSPQIRLAVVPERDGALIETELPAAVRSAAARFTERSKALGLLADPRRLAKVALGRLEADAVVLTIERHRLDARSARIVGRREYHRYRLDDAGRLIGGRFKTRDLP